MALLCRNLMIALMTGSLVGGVMFPGEEDKRQHETARHGKATGPLGPLPSPVEMTSIEACLQSHSLSACFGGTTIQTCLRGGEPIGSCLETGAMQALGAGSGSPLSLGSGLVLRQEDIKHGRQVDPREAGSLFEALSFYMEHRSLEWDLGMLFPGLFMKVGPGSTGGILHFTMDNTRVIDERNLGTGRLLLKRTLLPILLGLKLSVASLLPLIIGALILITKKALILGKLGFLISTFSALGSSGNGGVYGDSLGTYGADYPYGRQPLAFPQAHYHNHIQDSHPWTYFK